MSLVLDIVEPMELQGFIRELDPAVYGFTLQQYLPNTTDLVTKFAFDRSDAERQRMASFRGYDVEAEIGSRPGFARVEGEILPISKKLLLGEEQNLKLAELQGQNGQLANQVFNDAELLTESVLARIEFARGEALFKAEVSFANDRGFRTAKVDYGPVTALTAPAVLWTTHATATPIADLMVMVEDYMAANGGQRPAIVLTSSKVVSNFLLCQEVKNYMAVGGLVPSLVTQEQGNRILSALGIPPLVAYDTEVNVGGANQRVTPANDLALLPAPNAARFGQTQFGVTAEALKLVSKGAQEVATAPGLTGVVMETEDPVGTWTKVSGLVLPVIKDSKKIGTATVVA